MCGCMINGVSTTVEHELVYRSDSKYRIAGFFEGEYFHEYHAIVTVRENILRESFNYQQITC